MYDMEGKLLTGWCRIVGGKDGNYFIIFVCLYYILIYLFRGTNSLGKIAIRGGDGVCGINMKVVYPTSSTYPKP